MKLTKILISICIFNIALIGDYVVFWSGAAQSFVFRAIADNVLHAILGCLSAILFSCEQKFFPYSGGFNVIFCTIFSSLIDIDHVFVAKSIHIKDYTNLKERGIFHCTTFCLLITAALFTYSYTYQSLNTYTATWMLILAYTSHHIRDANRRGLWMFPFGHTPPINKYLYATLVTILPHIFANLYFIFKPDFKQDLDYSLVV